MAAEHKPHGEHGHGDEPHVLPLYIYWGVFGALLVLTVLTVQVSYWDLGPLSLPIAMAVALVKASLVIGFFMHLRYDNRFLSLILAVSILFIAVFFLFTSFDLTTREDVVREEGTFSKLQEKKLKEKESAARPAVFSTPFEGVVRPALSASLLPVPAPRPVERPLVPAPAPRPVERPALPAPAPRPVERPLARVPAPRPVERPAPAPVKAGFVVDPAKARHGKSVFEGSGACWTCHGKEGDGKGIAAAALSVKPSNFAKGEFRYGSTLQAVLKILNEGSPNKTSGMAAYAYLSEADRLALAHYVLSFAKK